MAEAGQTEHKTYPTWPFVATGVVLAAVVLLLCFSIESAFEDILRWSGFVYVFLVVMALRLLAYICHGVVRLWKPAAIGDGLVPGSPATWLALVVIWCQLASLVAIALIGPALVVALVADSDLHQALFQAFVLIAVGAAFVGIGGGAIRDLVALAQSRWWGVARDLNGFDGVYPLDAGSERR